MTVVLSVGQQLPDWDLLPLFCEQCNKPIGHVARWLLKLWGDTYCSDSCAVLAEWYAPERR